jgi:hypothetical protein
MKNLNSHLQESNLSLIPTLAASWLELFQAFSEKVKAKEPDKEPIKVLGKLIDDYEQCKAFFLTPITSEKLKEAYTKQRKRDKAIHDLLREVIYSDSEIVNWVKKSKTTHICRHILFDICNSYLFDGIVQIPKGLRDEILFAFNSDDTFEQMLLLHHQLNFYLIPALLREN